MQIRRIWYQNLLVCLQMGILFSKAITYKPNKRVQCRPCPLTGRSACLRDQRSAHIGSINIFFLTWIHKWRNSKTLSISCHFCANFSSPIFLWYLLERLVYWFRIVIIPSQLTASLYQALIIKGAKEAAWAEMFCVTMVRNSRNVNSKCGDAVASSLLQEYLS